MCVVQKVYWLNSKMQIKNFKIFKNLLINICRKRDKSLLDSISFQMMIYSKFFLRLNNRQQCNPTWKKSLKTFTRFSLIIKNTLLQCFQLKNKKLILLIMSIQMKRMFKIGWMKLKRWWSFLSDSNFKDQSMFIQTQKEHNGHVIIQANVY